MKKLSNISSYIIYSIAILFLIIINWIMLGQQVNYNEREEMLLSLHHLSFYICLILSVVLLVIIKPLLKKILPRFTFLIGTIVWLIIGTIYILKAPNIPNPVAYDQTNCWFLSTDVINGNYHNLFLSPYLEVYPYQIGIVSYDVLMQLMFGDNVIPVYFLNLIMAVGVIYLQWKCTNLFLDNKLEIANYTLILSFLFLPLLYFVVFLYGNIPGFLAMFLAVYYGLRYLKDDKKYKYSWIGMLLFGSLANLIKSNYIVPVIALVIIYLLKVLVTKKYKLILIVVAMFLSLGLVSKSVSSYYEMKVDKHFSKGIPKVAWIAMGLQYTTGDPSGSAGWFNDYTERTYYANNKDYDKTKKEAEQFVTQQVTKFIDHPKEGYQFFSKKLVSTWGDPMYESILSGPNQYLYIDSINNNKNDIYDFIRQMVNIVDIVIVLFSLVYIFKSFKLMNDYKLFILLFVIGGFIFHFFWETKSQYMFQYVYCLIPLSAIAISNMSNFFQTFKRNK